MLKTVHQNFTLTAIKQPQEEDFGFLNNNYKFHPLVLSELAHPTFHPKIEHYEDHSFLIFRFPQFRQTIHEIKPSEVDFIVTPRELIMVYYEDWEELDTLLQNLEENTQKRQEFFEASPSFLLYKIIDHLFVALSRQMDHISKKVDGIETRLFKDNEEKMVFIISLLRREAIDFKRIAGPNIKILEELRARSDAVFPGSMRPYWHKLYAFNDRFNYFMEGQVETLHILHETNESLLSNKISSVIKVLTIFSVVLLPLTLFASIFGMNVKNMPLIGHPYDFWIVLTLMGISTLIMLLVFKLKKWM